MEATIPQKKKKDKLGWILIILACAVYFSSYVMRYSYSVSNEAFYPAVGLSKSQAGLIGTALFLSYGTGQIVSGLLGDKLKPHLIILAGLVIGSVCNFIFPLYSALWYYITVWAINGFAQAMLWPPLVKILSDKLSPQRCSAAIVLVTACANAATVILYLVVPLIISVAGSWKPVFIIAGIFAAVIAVLWGIGYAVVAKKKAAQTVSAEESVPADAAAKPTEPRPEEPKKKVNMMKLIAGSGLITVMLAIIAQGFLRDGITTWLPSIVSETFGVSSIIGILTTVVLPILAIVMIYLTKWLFRKLKTNEVKLSIIFFIVVLALGVALVFLYKWKMALTVGASSGLCAISHGINLLLIGYIPPRFAKTGRASTVSGVLNACTYIGSGISNYLFGRIAELIGWRFVILSWIIIAALGLVACLLSLRRWNRYLKEHTDQN